MSQRNGFVEDNFRFKTCSACQISKPIQEFGIRARECRKCGGPRSRSTTDRIKRRLYELKQRARMFGVPFDMTADDLKPYPTHCPILGILLVYGPTKKGTRDSAASIDRIIPKLGYVKSNVAIISMRANRLKNNATLCELQAIIDWMKSQTE